MIYRPDVNKYKRMIDDLKIYQSVHHFKELLTYKNISSILEAESSYDTEALK